MSEITFNAPTKDSSEQSQIESLQTTLASLNQQVIILQETLSERDQKIKDLEMKLSEYRQTGKIEEKQRVDDTLTIVGALIKLSKFLSSLRKDVSAPTA